MPIKTRACVTVVCDVCGETLTDPESEATVHFPDADEAQKTAHGYQWLVLSNGEFLCVDRDPEHQAFLDALMPPEPVFVPTGQLDLDGGEAS
jgi:hypothetical protein